MNRVGILFMFHFKGRRAVYANILWGAPFVKKVGTIQKFNSLLYKYNSHVASLHI